MGNNIFQIDSECVKSFYQKTNYLIEYSTDCLSEEYCTVYFSSNNIYYPNTYNVFRKRIIEQDFYEWHNNKLQGSYKHIFVRDIFKQWYLMGINDDINSPDKVLDFLKKETRGYKLITLGSSAGGYAAVLYGSLLNADRILTFNAQFEIKSLLKVSREDINPLVFRFQDRQVSKYFDTRNFINNNLDIFYFYSKKSEWDIEQHDYIADLPRIHKIGFLTSHHGIPILRNNLEPLLNMSKDELLSLSRNSPYNVFLFSLRLVGFRRTLFCWIVQTRKRFRKRISNRIYRIINSRV